MLSGSSDRPNDLSLRQAGFLINMTTVPSMHVWKVGSKWPEMYETFESVLRFLCALKRHDDT